MSGGNAEGVISSWGGWIMELEVDFGCGSLIDDVVPGVPSPFLLDDEGLTSEELGLIVDGGKSAVSDGENKNSKERSFESFIMIEIASSIGASFAFWGAGGGISLSARVLVGVLTDFSATTNDPNLALKESRTPASTSSCSWVPSRVAFPPSLSLVLTGTYRPHDFAISDAAREICCCTRGLEEVCEMILQILRRTSGAYSEVATA